MRFRESWKSGTALVLVFSFLCLSLPTSPAVAGWIPTRKALAPQERLASALEREEIAAALRELGIDPAEAQRRALGLTDAEAREALERLAAMPAGGDPLGVIVGSAVFVFLVLLITDILGFTDVFPFVKRTVR
ncbi:PA2779 family protein [Deferrisoma palaeochoriense]